MNKAGYCWRCEAACTQRCSQCRVAFYCSKECQIKDKWRHKPDCDAAALKTQCSSCGREQEGMMKCSNCLEVFYCSTECQRNDWVQHKSSCQESVDKTLELVEEMKQLFENEEKNPGLAETYYWGNAPAVDLLNMSMNEGDEYSDPLALLLCGVGDPRNVLLTIASLPDVYKQKVTFVLNDICQCTLARTILLLYMLYKGGDDVAGTVVRVWYSVCILEQDFAFLTSALQDLVTASELRTLTGGLMEVSADQLSQLKSVWTTWIRYSRRKGPWVKELRQAATSYFGSEWEDTVWEYMHGIPKEHRKSTLKFFHTGIFYSSTNERELTRQNFTLTGQGVLRFKVSSDFDYSIPPAVLPFTGWDYKAIKKTGCHAASLPKMYTIYLKQILQKCVQKLSSGQVKFHFILCDVRNVEASLPIDLKYDRITTSNLWDYCPLTTLLTKFKGFLNKSNPHAVMLTGTISWSHNFMPEIIHVLPSLSCKDDLPHRALKDTRNYELANFSGPFAVVEYVDFTDQFNMFLRASLLTSCTDKELALLRSKKRIPSVKSLVSSLGLHLRDFIRNENTVFPFRWALNCRRVVLLHGYERELEWKLVLIASAAEEAANK